MESSKELQVTRIRQNFSIKNICIHTHFLFVIIFFAMSISGRKFSYFLFVTIRIFKYPVIQLMAAMVFIIKSSPSNNRGR